VESELGHGTTVRMTFRLPHEDDTHVIQVSSS
jgi:hypothetical protein